MPIVVFWRLINFFIVLFLLIIVSFCYILSHSGRKHKTETIFRKCSKAKQEVISYHQLEKPDSHQDDSPRLGVLNGAGRIKQVKKFNYPARDEKGDGKFNTGIERRIRIMKSAF